MRKGSPLPLLKDDVQIHQGVSPCLPQGQAGLRLGSKSIHINQEFEPTPSLGFPRQDKRGRAAVTSPLSGLPRHWNEMAWQISVRLCAAGPREDYV